MAGTYLLCVAVVGLLLGCSCGQMTIRSLEIRSDIRYRFATTLVTSTFFNDHSRAQQAVFEVILPNEAFISNFSMIILGKEYVGEVKEKMTAKRQYQDAVFRGQSAGYISNKARHSNTFNVNVNVVGGTSVTFHLTYQQLLVRCHGYYEQKIRVNPRQKVNALKIEVFIQEKRNITYLEIPGLNNEIPTDIDSSENTLITVERPSPQTAYVVYEPSITDQGPDGFHDKQFVVQYDVARTSPAGEVLVVDGYFVHFFVPQNETAFQPLPKDIIFIIDVSGSMTGRKLEQVKGAMATILDELREGDRFNILTFDDKFKMWKDRMVSANTDHILNAKQFVKSMQADGATDIQLAFYKGLQFLINDRDLNHVPIVFFLTDGQPTSGIRDPSEIAVAVKRDNEGIGAIFSLAFGDDADYDLLKKISAQNDGIARKIYEASDASKQVEGFYDEISTAILTSVKVEYLNTTVDPDSLTKTDFKNLFNGSEIVICGTISNDFDMQNDIGITVTGHGFQGDVVLVLPDSSVDSLVIDEIAPKNPFFSIPRDLASIIEKSWAYLTIKDLLQKKLQATAIVIKDDIDNAVLDLSLKYNFVTPLTGMVVTKSEKSELATFNIKGDDYESPEDSVSHYLMSSPMSKSPSFAHRSMQHPAHFDPSSYVNHNRQATDGRLHGMTTNRQDFADKLLYPVTHLPQRSSHKHPKNRKTKNRKGKKKYGKRNKTGKNRKCKNVLLGHLEGVAIQANKPAKTTLCSKLVGRVRKPGGFNILPVIRGGPQVVLFFKKGPAKFINGLEKVLITTSGASLQVDVSAMNSSISVQYSAPFNISVTNQSDCCRLAIRGPDVNVLIFKTRQEQKNKCFNSYFVSVQVRKAPPRTKGRRFDVWHLMHKGKTVNRKDSLQPNPVCDGRKVSKLKLKKPKHKIIPKSDYVISF